MLENDLGLMSENGDMQDDKNKAEAEVLADAKFNSDAEMSMTDAVVDKTAGVQELEKLLIYIAKELVDKPEEVQVSHKDDGDLTILELRVAKDDLGKVIGKQGRTARAMRIVLGAVATRCRVRYLLEIVE